jgi:hypothetical protein
MKEFLITAVIKMEICKKNISSGVKVNRHFGGTFRLHHQSQELSQARNQHEADRKSSWTLHMEEICRSVISVGLHQTTDCYSPNFITTAGGNLKPVKLFMIINWIIIHFCYNNRRRNGKL